MTGREVTLKSRVSVSDLPPQYSDTVVTNYRSHVSPTSINPTTASNASFAASDGLRHSPQPNEPIKAKKLCLGIGGSAATSTSKSSLTPTKREGGVVEKNNSEAFVSKEQGCEDSSSRELWNYVNTDLGDFYEFMSYDVDEVEDECDFLRGIKDIDEFELPSWYIESHLDKEEDVKVKGSQAARADHQTQEFENQEVTFVIKNASLAVSVYGNQISTLEREILQSTLALESDLEKSLTLASLVQSPEAFKQALTDLYQITATSIARDPFLPPIAFSSGTAGAEGPWEKINSKDLAALLVPKEETGESGSYYEPVAKVTTELVQVKQEILPLAEVKQETVEFEVTQEMVGVKQGWDASWHQVPPGQDAVNYQNVQDKLQRLGELWFTRFKEADDDGIDTASGERANPDLIRLKVASDLRRGGLWINDKEKLIGHCPGIPIGACFTYRIEMALIGLHITHLCGIAIIPAALSPFKKPISPSVVLLTGGLDKYKDDRDMGDTVIYCGHGGYSAKTKKHRDQDLERGNLALTNSLELEVPVRLIRGHRDPRGKTGRLYSYDGLYKVINLNYEVGVKGNKVFLFTMVRLPGQGPLPVPSKDALLFRAQDEGDAYYFRPSETSRRIRTPLLENKASKVTRRPRSAWRSCSTDSDSDISVRLCSSPKIRALSNSSNSDSGTSMVLVTYTPPCTRSRAKKFGIE
ncbi:hypothetical protein R1flu_026484 [Riccia fluitans]|uniref:YDG domain-containing protein n=1 Tax=Riccia fluitans TaxID=41844 RepID=A0ABD1XG44_9MARC